MANLNSALPGIYREFSSSESSGEEVEGDEEEEGEKDVDSTSDSPKKLLKAATPRASMIAQVLVLLLEY